MTIEQESLDLVGQSNRVAAGGFGSMHPLHQASQRISEFREGRSAFKARDLVGLLLSHGARAWRSSQPVAVTRIKVRMPGGASAVRLRTR